ncbi:MAG: Hsp20/alpha crystallin family protein [Halobacteriota archaeon]|uniref:Hsp20/alpha crystallin family protein n=1 Tax=Natronomonas sp. TaxID=2184060 RepID=UPI003974D944
MALPTSPTTSWMQSLDFPSQLFGTGRNDYELYEEDDEFVLSVEMPGFDADGITVSWDDGVLNIAAEHDDERRGQRKTYHRRFRFPKDVDDDAITAEYTNGVLGVRLPVMTGAPVSGTEIEIET